MSYGASVTDAYRQAGVFTGRFLKGDKLADLPVQQAVKVELIVNPKAAKALGTEMPLSLLLRINETIEIRTNAKHPSRLAAQCAFMPAAQRQMIHKRQHVKNRDPGDRQQQQRREHPRDVEAISRFGDAIGEP